MTPLWQLTIARFREFVREPAALFWVYAFPLILAIILGMAFQSRPVEKIRVDIRTDGPGGPATAAAMQERLARDPRFVMILGDEAACRNRLRTAKTDVVLNPGSGATVADYLFEPNRAESLLAKTAADHTLLRAANPTTPVPAEATIDEPGGRYIDFLVPGLLGLNLMGGGLFGVGFAVVDMRVRKLLKRFLATPMRRTDFLLSILLSRLVFTLVDISVLVGVTYLLFDIRIRGNLLAFAGLVLAGGVCFAGIGLLIGCRAKTLETVSGLMNAVMLPMYLLGGVFFSADRFPEAMQPLIQALPLTVLNNGLRAVMNDGAGFEAVVIPIAVLTLWGVVSFAIALRYFRWR